LSDSPYSRRRDCSLYSQLILLDAQSSLNIFSGVTGNGSGGIDTALTALAFLGKKVSTKGALASNFTSFGNLYALSCPFVGLELWHYYSPYYFSGLSPEHCQQTIFYG
jgi:hypothetical protein